MINCKTCRFWKERTAEWLKDECHHGEKFVFFHSAPSGGSHYVTKFPEVAADDYCGYYEPTERSHA